MTSPEAVETFQYVKSNQTTSKTIAALQNKLTNVWNDRHVHTRAVQMFSRKAQMQTDVQRSDNNGTWMGPFVHWQNRVPNYALLYVDCSHFPLLELRFSVLEDARGVEFKLLMGHTALWQECKQSFISCRTVFKSLNILFFFIRAKWCNSNYMAHKTLN